MNLQDFHSHLKEKPHYSLVLLQNIMVDKQINMVEELMKISHQVLVTMKAVPLGQQAGQRVLSGLIPLLEQASGSAAGLPEDDWSNFAPGFALASSWHETQYSRMFRS